VSTSKRKRKFSQDFSGKSKTDPSFAPSCNVNTIVKHYEATGIDPFPDAAKQVFGYATSKTYEEALRETAEVESAFASLPSHVRAQFANDPTRWLDSHETPKEAPEASEVVLDDPAPQDATAAEPEPEVQ